jgi:hypothetical protein
MVNVEEAGGVILVPTRHGDKRSGASTETAGSPIHLNAISAVTAMAQMNYRRLVRIGL